MPQVLAAFVNSLTADSDVRMVERHIEWERLVQAEREALAAAASSRPAAPTGSSPVEVPSQQREEQQQTALVRRKPALERGYDLARPAVLGRVQMPFGLGMHAGLGPRQAHGGACPL